MLINTCNKNINSKRNHSQQTFIGKDSSIIGKESTIIGKESTIIGKESTIIGKEYKYLSCVPGVDGKIHPEGVVQHRR